jgi:hypothetical protein
MDHNISESDLEQLRRKLNHGAGKSQEELTQIATQFASAHTKLRPRDKKEPLPLFTDEGVATGTTAPRWLCHVLGLRHRCAHILLVWESPALGKLLLLQIRAWGKDDSPGHLDISVGGHMTVDESSEAQQTTFAEMLQELHLSPSDLEGALKPVGGYAYDESRPSEHFHNSEWRDVYIGHLRPEAIGKVRFPDGEVAGVVLIPMGEADRLLEQTTIPMASALRKSLPRCLEMARRNG